MLSRRLHLPALTLGAALLSAAAPARADYPPCSKVPTDADKAAAKGLHEAAKQYYSKALYEEAIAKWNEAYGFDCTQPLVFLNIGNAYEKLPGQTAKAIDAFEIYVQRAGANADPEIAEKVKNLKKLLAQEKAQAAVDAMKPSYPPPPPGHQETPPPPPDQPHKGEGPGPWPWVVTGSGGALALIGIILLPVGAGKVSSAATVCPNRSCQSANTKLFSSTQISNAQSDGNTGLAMEDAGGALLGVGLAAVAGGVVWWAVTRPKAAAAPKASWHVAPTLAPGSYGLSAALRF